MSWCIWYFLQRCWSGQVLSVVIITRFQQGSPEVLSGVSPGMSLRIPHGSLGMFLRIKYSSQARAKKRERGFVWTILLLRFPWCFPEFASSISSGSTWKYPIFIGMLQKALPGMSGISSGNIPEILPRRALFISNTIQLYRFHDLGASSILRVWELHVTQI